MQIDTMSLINNTPIPVKLPIQPIGEIRQEVKTVQGNSTQTSKDLPNDLNKEKKYTEEEILGPINNANKALEGHDTYLQFSVHKETKQVMVKIMNTKTNEVIQEIPSEKLLDGFAKMLELAGLLVDKKV